MTSHRQRRSRGLAGAGFAAVAALCGPGALSGDRATTAADGGGTRNFVVTYFYASLPLDPREVDCPTGMATPPAPSDYADREPYRSMDPKELKRISDDQQERLLRMRNRGPNGENVCAMPWLEPETTMPIGQGKRYNGIDLDGGRRHPGCAQTSLVASDGLTGVDNQYSRIYACVEQRRGPDGYLPTYEIGLMQSGEFTLLVQVTDVDDARNDDAVQVMLTSSPDPLTKSSDGKGLVAHASFTPTDIGKYQNLFRGRIKDGVLTTDPITDVTLPGNQHKREVHFKGAQLRLRMKEDGSLKGVFGGYMDIKEWYNGGPSANAGEQLAGPFKCPAIWNAMNSLADGYPDPKTGKCTALSFSYDVEGVPAFITPQARRTAQPAQPRAASGGAS